MFHNIIHLPHTPYLKYRHKKLLVKGSTYRKILEKAFEHSSTYLENLDYEKVCATKSMESLRQTLNKPLTKNGEAGDLVIDELVKDVEGGLLSSAGSRFFAWVIGGSTPAALAADWLTSTWDQNAALYACSSAEAIIEEVVGDWLKQLLRLPSEASFAFTTDCQMAHVTGLAAARNEVLRRQAWDVEVEGLSGAPKIKILTNKQLHASVERAARFLGMVNAV